MTEELEHYILAHIDPEPQNLARLNRDTHVNCLYANMCSGHLQGETAKDVHAHDQPEARA